MPGRVLGQRSANRDLPLEHPEACPPIAERNELRFTNTTERMRVTRIGEVGSTAWLKTMEVQAEEEAEAAR